MRIDNLMKLFFKISISFTIFVQPAYAQIIGAIYAIEGEWWVQQNKQSSRELIFNDINIRWVSVYSGAEFTLRSKKGCLYYWLLENNNATYYSHCPNPEGSPLVLYNKAPPLYDLHTIEIILNKERGGGLYELNKATHFPKNTAIANDTLRLSWAAYHPNEKLKSISLDGRVLAFSTIENEVALSVENKLNWQEWQITLSNGNRYIGRVKKLTESNKNDLRKEIEKLDDGKPTDIKLSRALLYLKYELYLNAWNEFYLLSQEDKTLGGKALMLATERIMGEVTSKP